MSSARRSPEAVLPLAWRPFWLAGAVAIVVSILAGSLLPGPVIETYVFNDKLEHAFAYFVLTFWLTGIVERRRYLWVALIPVVLGALMEIAQGRLTTTRYADPHDLLANLAGIAVALGLAYPALGGWAARVESRLGAVPRR